MIFLPHIYQIDCNSWDLSLFLTWPITGTSPSTCGERLVVHSSLHQLFSAFRPNDGLISASSALFPGAPYNIYTLWWWNRSEDKSTCPGFSRTGEPPCPSREEWCLREEGWGWRRRGGVSIQEGCRVVSAGGGGAALCCYVSAHHRGTQDLFVSRRRGDSQLRKARSPPSKGKESISVSKSATCFKNPLRSDHGWSFRCLWLSLIISLKPDQACPARRSDP